MGETDHVSPHGFCSGAVDKEMKILILFVTILFAVGPSAGLYFHIRETEEKCFIEEVPDETMVVGTFIILVNKNTHRVFIKSIGINSVYSNILTRL